MAKDRQDTATRKQAKDSKDNVWYDACCPDCGRWEIEQIEGKDVVPKFCPGCGCAVIHINDLPDFSSLTPPQAVEALRKIDEARCGSEKG